MKAKLIGVSIGLALIWQVTAISVAASHGENDTDLAATNYAGISQTAATAAAVQHLQDNDPAGARIFALQALTISPIAPVALRTLAFAEQSLGRERNGNAMLSQAAALGWRDVPTQLWLAQAYLQSNDDAHAAQQLDAALRVQPSTPLYDMLDKLAADRTLAAALAERLALKPNWRSPYLRYGGSKDDDLAARAGLLWDMARTSARPTPLEILPTVQRLIGSNEAGSARQLWLQTQNIRTSLLYDGGFSDVDPPTPLPFQWTTLSLPGASVAAERDGGRTTVRATTDGSTSGALMHQMVILPQGHHELTYSPSLSAIDRETFGWSVRCWPSSKIVLDTAGAAAPPYGFDVPDDCRQQFIEFRVKSRPSAAGKSVTIASIDLR